MGSAEMGMEMVPSDTGMLAVSEPAGWLFDSDAEGILLELVDGVVDDVLFEELLHPAAEMSMAVHTARDSAFFILFIAFCFPPVIIK
jgi:hypothetical protein